MDANNATTDQPKSLSLWGYFIRSITTKYATFSGRARRKEYWGTFLFILIPMVLLSIAWGISFGTSLGEEEMQYMLANPQDTGFLYSLAMQDFFFWIFLIVSLAVMVPSYAVTCRRFHDVGISTTIFVVYVVIMLLQLILSFVPGTPLGLASIVSFLTLICNLGVLVIAFLPGTEGPNRYGPDPKPATPFSTTGTTV